MRVLKYLWSLAAVVVFVTIVVSGQPLAHADDPDKEILSIGVTGGVGSISAEWSAPAQPPKDYRLSWNRLDDEGQGGMVSWRDANSNTGGNAYPTATEYTVSGLAPGSYKVWVRARYTDNVSGSWRASSVVAVTGESEAPRHSHETPTLEPTKDPTPEPVILPPVVIFVTPEPIEEPKIARHTDTQDPDHPHIKAVTDVSDTYISNLNQGVLDGEQAAQAHVLTAGDESTSEMKQRLDSNNRGLITGVSLRMAGYSSSDKVSVYMRPQPTSGMSTAGAIGRIRHNFVSPELEPGYSDYYTFSPEGGSWLMGNSTGVYDLFIEVTRGEVTFYTTASDGEDAGSGGIIHNSACKGVYSYSHPPGHSPRYTCKGGNVEALYMAMVGTKCRTDVPKTPHIAGSHACTHDDATPAPTPEPVLILVFTDTLPAEADREERRVGDDIADAPNQKGVKTLRIGSTASGKIETSDDKDLFYLDLAPDTWYKVEIRGLNDSRENLTLSDPVLHLRNRSSAGSNVGGTTNEDGELLFTVPYTADGLFRSSLVEINNLDSRDYNEIFPAAVSKSSGIKTFVYQYFSTPPEKSKAGPDFLYVEDSYPETGYYLEVTTFNDIGTYEVQVTRSTPGSSQRFSNENDRITSPNYADVLSIINDVIDTGSNERTFDFAFDNLTDIPVSIDYPHDRDWVKLTGQVTTKKSSCSVSAPGARVKWARVTFGDEVSFNYSVSSTDQVKGLYLEITSSTSGDYVLTVSCEEPVAEVEATNPIRPDDDDPDKGAKTDLHHPLDANFLYPYDATRHPDGYKSTDFENGNSNRAEKAYLLRIGHSANVALEYAGDRDFLAVELTEGRRYRFTSRPTSVSGLQGVSRSVIELLSNDRMMGDSCKLARDGDGEDLNYVVAARGRPNPRVTEQVDLESNYSAFEFTAYRTGCFFVGIKGEGAPSAGGVRVTLSNR